jgi:hypothetical protein
VSARPQKPTQQDAVLYLKKPESSIGLIIVWTKNAQWLLFAQPKGVVRPITEDSVIVFLYMKDIIYASF